MPEVPSELLLFYQMITLPQLYGTVSHRFSHTEGHGHIAGTAETGRG